MRGKRGRCTKKDRRRRITPAGAGKTTETEKQHPRGTDHPRRCGENSDKDLLNFFKSGSPPQVRGKHCNLRTQGEFVRITPAGAGKTRPCSICRTRSGDHPRRCGENIVDYFYSFGAAGSPPQVRGKLCCDSVCHTCKRITPAGAGKTLVEHPRLKTNRDHPRRCGENNAIHGKRLNVVGSPPQVRGKLYYSPVSGTSRGITPAGAGKT